MANTKISALTDDPTPTGGNYFVEVDDTGGTPTTKRVNGYNLVKMGERNYKIVVTIASNNITVALKNLAGSDFSSVDPLVIKIGDSWRTITGALSVTVNAATNTFNAGASELATNEIDYFVYLSWRSASSAVVIGFSRIPYAYTYSQFSGTATNEKYAAFSTAPGSTDDVIVIGRIAATLSAGAGYTWTSTSQSAPTTLNTIQYPIYETRWLTWTPTLVGFSANPTNTYYKYRVNREIVTCRSRQQTNGTSNATNFTMTAPFTAVTNSNDSYLAAAGPYVDNSVQQTAMGFATIVNAAGTITCARDGAATAFTNSGGKRVGNFELNYPISLT